MDFEINELKQVTDRRANLQKILQDVTQKQDWMDNG